MVINKGRLINFVNGITGVATGSNALVNLPTNARYHRLKFNTVAINYTGGTGAAITQISGTAAGSGATGTLTISNGVPTAIAIVAGGTGWTIGDTFSIADATGTGAVFTVATVTGGPPGAIATATVTSSGTASACSPATVLTSIQQLVNGIPVRDIEPSQILTYVMAQGYYPALGELPLWYTNPTRNKIQRNDVTSWDLFGQSTFSIKFGISPSVTSPGISGSMEFDFLRNVRTDNGKEVVFLEPTAQHQYGYNLIAGRNDITTLPFDFPISRLWFLGSTPGNITQVELYQDGNKWFEVTLADLEEMYRQYGFTFGQPDWLNQTQPGNATLLGAYETPRYYDAAFISDEDGRWSKRLSVANSLTIRIYSAVQQSVTIMAETMPGAYA
jgi:hypothetical protein